jgi:hypothetical protein
MKRWMLSALALLLCASAADGQASLRVRAESATHAPLAGALVALIDSSNRVVTEALSSAQGFASLDAAPGLYRVRVRRIGYRPFYSAPLAVPQADILVLRVESPRVVLNELVVSASAQCGRINPDAETLASLWEEISKALRSSQLTVADLQEIARVQTYVREVGLTGEVITSDSTNRSVVNRRPFAAVDPESLVSLGYVRGDEQKGWDFFAPDEAVLLSDGFAATHCFRAVRQRSRGGQIGLAFEPAPRRRHADIRGVIWLDEGSSELREVEFDFVNAGVLSEFRPRGYSRFRRMASGAWIVSDWQLQLPRLGRKDPVRNETQIIGTIQHGGRIVLASAISPVARTVKVSGIVFDSLFMTPLSRAIVSVGSRTVKTDNAGRFELPNVTAGPLVITFTHRIVSSLGLLGYDRPLFLTGDTSVVLATPSRQTVWMRICRAQPAGSEASEKGILHGVVRNETGAPLDSSRVTVRLDEAAPAPSGPQASSQSVVEVTTDRSGHYAVCGFRRLASGTLSAMRNGVASEKKAFEFGGNLLVRKDLTLNRAGSSATASAHEIVVSVTDSAGDAVADAVVRIDGTTSSALTNEEGRALLQTSQTQLVITVRRLGYADQAIEIKLGEARRQLLKVVLGVREGRT